MSKRLTESQKEFVRAIHKKDLAFVTGAAGTGKTYIACSTALEYLDTRQVDKIIICRPLVATEDIGFLPGTLKDKIDPFLDPLIEVLSEIYDKRTINRFLEEDKIEVKTLAHMRGRTFSNAFIILDEAQNCTITQMSMFLTRFGDNIKCAVIGDLKQIDIMPGHSGLKWSIDKLKNCNLIAFCDFSKEEVVRSRLVKEIMKHIYA